jgi:molecular chaperone GrpE
MSRKKTFFDKVSDFIFGEPIPVLNDTDLQLVRELHQKLDNLSTALNSSQTRLEPSNGQSASAGQAEAEMAKPDQPDELTEQIRKLAKTQFKANALQESQLAQQQATIESLQKAVDQQEKLLAELDRQREQAVAAAQLELLKTILPALDSLDAAFGSGRRQVLQLPMSREARQAVIAWLDGLRLARLRLLDLLAVYDIRPIQTVGQPFDPRYHVAIAVDTSGRVPDGTIVAEDRPGYANSARILREADVVVARSK